MYTAISDTTLLGAPSRRAWIRQLFPCLTRQRGGGLDISSSDDSDETQSLKGVARTLMQEENAAKDRCDTKLYGGSEKCPMPELTKRNNWSIAQLLEFPK